MRKRISEIRDEFYQTARIFAKVRDSLLPEVIHSQLGYLNGLLYAMGEDKITLDNILLQTPVQLKPLDYVSDTELGVED